jgi:hypothetical protein
MEQELAETVTLARNGGDFRAAEHKLEADLLLERTKVRVLIDELEVPLNMHRYYIILYYCKRALSGPLRS